MQTATATSSRITEPVIPEQTGLQRPPWLEEELQVLRENYLVHGLRECQRLLPLRSPGSIMNKAHGLGLLRSPHAKPAQSTPAIDEAIRKIYAMPVSRNGRSTMNHYRVRVFAERIGRTRQWVYSRALKLGVTRAPMSMNWSEEEIQIIEGAEEIGIHSISKRLRKAGYSRTPAAIRAVMEKRGLKVEADDPDIYAAEHVAKLLGVAGVSVRRWIESGKLKAERPAPDTAWRIRKDDLREFMIEQQALWDHRKVQQQWWLIEILTGRIARAI